MTLHEVEISRHSLLKNTVSASSPAFMHKLLEDVDAFSTHSVSSIFEHAGVRSRTGDNNEFSRNFNAELVDPLGKETVDRGVLPVRIRTSLKLNSSWSNRLVAERLSPIILDRNGAPLRFVCSVVRRAGVKQLQFLHAYRSGNILIAPVYGEIMCNFIAAMFVDIDNPDAVFYVRISDKFRYTAAMGDVKDLLVSISRAQQGDDGASRKPAIVTGAMVNNYGHTVLNHCSAISILSNSAYSAAVSKIYVGDDDFLEFSDHLASSGKTVALSSCYRSEAGAYAVAEPLLPIVTKLPVRRSLDFIIDRALTAGSSASRQRGTLGPALLFTLDARSGIRRCRNVRDILREAVACFEKAAQSFTLIVDGNTAKAHPATASDALDDSHAFDAGMGARLAAELNLPASSVISLDGMRLSSKIRTCAKFDVRLCVAPLGSSLMFPIYFLNVPTLGYGESRMAGLMDKEWLWHVGPGCHAQRTLSLTIIPASDEGKEGYVVDVEALRSLADALLRNVGRPADAPTEA